MFFFIPSLFADLHFKADCGCHPCGTGQFFQCFFPSSLIYHFVQGEVVARLVVHATLGGERLQIREAAVSVLSKEEALRRLESMIR